MLLAVCVGLGGTYRTAWADAVEESHEHYERGAALYKQERYEEALHEFQVAFDRLQKPVLVYNIGHCYRRLGQPREALSSYLRYQQLAPELPADEDAKLRGFIAQMRALAAPPAQTPPPPALALLPTVTAAPAAAPASHRGLWIGLGVTGGALVIGAVVAGVVLGTRGSMGAAVVVDAR